MQKNLEAKQIVDRLRCSSSHWKIDIRKCLQCPYHTKEKCDGMFVPEVNIGGEGYYLVCNTEKIFRDAADMIEQLASEGTVKVGWATHQKMLDAKDREISELKIEVLQLKRQLGMYQDD